MRGLEKEWPSFRLVKARLKRRQKSFSEAFLRRGSPSPLTRTKSQDFTILAFPFACSVCWTNTIGLKKANNFN